MIIYNGKKMAVKVVGTGGGGITGTPITVTTAEAMNTILASATASDYGKIYKYVGETNSTYTQNSYYILEA